MSGEVIYYLRPCEQGRYLDGTLGLGGHTLNILEACRGKCSVLGIDLDQEAIEISRDRLAGFAERVHFFQDSYRNFDFHLEELGWDTLDGAVLDLGVSSLQLERGDKGFSFIKNGPLDMRMDKSCGAPSAAQLLNRISAHELKNIISRYGQEPMAGRIARAIIDSRRKKPIKTTLELAAIVEQAYPPKRRAMARNHPATRTFQALRIAVNKELEDLEYFLKKIVSRMKTGARIVIISFHSLEDRIVKHSFKQEASGCLCPPGFALCACGRTRRLKILTKKPVTPQEQEVMDNPRSRSAKLRSAERI